MIAGQRRMTQAVIDIQCDRRTHTHRPSLMYAGATIDAKLGTMRSACDFWAARAVGSGGRW